MAEIAQQNAQQLADASQEREQLIRDGFIQVPSYGRIWNQVGSILKGIYDIGEVERPDSVRFGFARTDNPAGVVTDFDRDGLTYVATHPNFPLSLDRMFKDKARIEQIINTAATYVIAYGTFVHGSRTNRTSRTDRTTGLTAAQYFKSSIEPGIWESKFDEERDARRALPHRFAARIALGPTIWGLGRDYVRELSNDVEFPLPAHLAAFANPLTMDEAKRLTFVVQAGMKG